jgi:pilus assembly protein TadC
MPEPAVAPAHAAGPPRPPPAVRVGALGAAATASALVVPGRAGLVLAAVVAVGGWVLLDRLGSNSDADGRAERVRHDLPYALDLLAGVLSAGAALDAALAVVGPAVGGPVGTAFASVATAMRLGQPAAQAWQLVDGPDSLVDVGRTLVRASVSGTAVADSVRRAAVAQRATARVAAESVARRAGVLAVLPLGLCFLPAFVLLAVVPMVAGVAARVTTGG